MPPRCADEDCPALAIVQCRADDFGPCSGVHVGVFVEDNAVEVKSSKGIGVIGTVYAYPSYVMRKVNTEFSLIKLDPAFRKNTASLTQMIPGHPLTLLKERAYICKSRHGMTARNDGVDEIVDAGIGFSGASMTDNANPSLCAPVKRYKLLPGHVVQIKRAGLKDEM